MNVRQKLMSKKVMGVPAFLIALAVLSVGGMALVATYGTHTATVTVVQGITLPSSTYTLIDANTSSEYIYSIEISNAGNMGASVNLNGVVSNATDVITDGSVTVSYSPANPVPVTANGITTVTATVTLSPVANPDTYTITTEVTP